MIDKRDLVTTGTIVFCAAFMYISVDYHQGQLIHTEHKAYRRGVADVLTAFRADDMVGICTIVEDYQIDKRIEPDE